MPGSKYDRTFLQLADYFFFPIFSRSPSANGSDELDFLAAPPPPDEFLFCGSFGLVLLMSPKPSPMPSISPPLAGIGFGLFLLAAVLRYPGLLWAETIVFPLELTLETSLGPFIAGFAGAEFGLETPTGPLDLTDVGPAGLLLGGGF